MSAASDEACRLAINIGLTEVEARRTITSARGRAAA
jgi:hypothetical protein